MKNPVRSAKLGAAAAVMPAFLVLTAGCLAGAPVTPAPPASRPVPVVCCAGDSLMRPIPTRLYELTRFSPGSFILKDWAQGGLSSETYLSFFDRRAAVRNRLQPDLILLQLGTNDARPLLEGRLRPDEFERNLRAIVGRFRGFRDRAGRPCPILIASAPPFRDADAAAKNEVLLKVVNPGLRRLAEDEGLTFVDNHAILADRPDLYDPDGVHPNPRGEKRLARHWLHWIRAALKSPSP
jgi:lysophospholipase L1-like esterase